MRSCKTPYCVVCRVSIESSCLDEVRIFRQDGNWEKYERKPGILFMDAEQLEKKYFKGYKNSFWRSLYRVIYYDPVEEKFVLSGIGQARNHHRDVYLATPKESGKAFIGNTGRATRQTKQFHTQFYKSSHLKLWVYGNKNIKDWRKVHLPIDMGCWKLAQWQLGPWIAHDNMELFAAIMLDYSARNPFFGHFATGDPYRINKVLNIIARSRRVKSSSSSSSEDHHLKQRSRHSRLSSLPLELLDLVFNFLSIDDILSFETAVGMVVADSYWRLRAAWDIVEMDQIGDGGDINWRYLFTRLEALKESREFENRSAVVGILHDEIRPIFMQNLKERVFPRLEEIMAQVLREHYYETYCKLLKY